MKRPTSLTSRLTLSFGAVAMIGFLAFGWIIEHSIENHFAAEDAKELRMIVQAVEQSLTSLQSKYDLTQVKQRFDDLMVGHHGPLLHINDRSGNVLYSNSRENLSLMPMPPTYQLSHGVIQQWNDAQYNYRVLIQQVAGGSNGPFTIIVAVAIDFHLHFINNFRRTLWLMVTSGIVIMGLMGWIAVRHGHRPLRHMVNQIRHISTNDLNNRLSSDTVPVELAELAESFNELLQRMEEAFNRLSNFSADIAHELRTPVTNLMTQTQVALSLVRSTEEYQEILYSSIEEYERMAQMIGDMLFLAKADNDLNPLNREDIDLKSEVCNLFDYYEAWAEERHVSLVQEGDAHVQGDRLMLRRALSNLLSNAIRHTPAGCSVSLKLISSEKSLFIEVQNPGTPLPVEHQARVFDRFYRIDPSRQRSGEGAGLGLAIVKSIIEAHGGKIVATADKIGTQFQITLPVSDRCTT
ncbi:MAG: heavy metal sensor histidine kinase [Candidatus Polarisedimenticolaceae bacterium]|nr:heavy metal sensor histidine kinase [Candidatus Polarisedimenticolaceae bacterium]